MKRRTIGHYEILRKIGAGGVGRGVPGHRHAAAAAGGAEAAEARRAVAGAGAHDPAPRSPPGLGHRPPQRLRHLRRRRSAFRVRRRGRSLHRDAVHSRQVAGQGDCGGPGQPATGALRGHPDRRRPLCRAPAGHLPSRPEARQRDADRRRPDQDSRLRSGPPAQSGRGRLRPRRAPGRRKPPLPRPPTPRAAAPSPTWRRSSSSPGDRQSSPMYSPWA